MSACHPLFSVISVVFNDAAGLRRTEASVSEQEEGNFEWVVVDGGSTDGTVGFLQSLTLPSLSWVSERDRGIYDAMNKGTARARGRYVVYMNAGDAFSDAACLRDVRISLEQAGWPQLLYGGANYRFSDGKLRYRAPRHFESAIRHGLPAIHQATFYLREFLDQPPYDLSYRVSSDYYISARCFLRGARACYLDRPLADFTVGGNSMQKSRESRRECWRLQKEVLRLGLPARIVSAFRRYLAHQTLAGLHQMRKNRST